MPIQQISSRLREGLKRVAVVLRWLWRETVVKIEFACKCGWRCWTVVLRKEVLALLATIFVAALFVTEWRTTSAIIDDFEIAPSLAQQGLTSTAVANELDARIQGIYYTSSTWMRMRYLSPDQPVEYVIPGTGISLTTLIGELRRLVGSPQLRVRGAILAFGSGLQTVVIIERVGDSGSVKTYRIDDPQSDCVLMEMASSPNKSVLSAIDAQLTCAAEVILQNTQPYILAAYYNQVGAQRRATDLLHSILRLSPTKDGYWAYNSLGGIARAKANAAATADARSVLQEEARNDFEQANKIYLAAKSKGRLAPFPLAYENLGFLYQDQGNADAAENAFKSALKEDPSYTLAYSAQAQLAEWKAARTDDAAAKQDLYAAADKLFQVAIDATPSEDGRQAAQIWTDWAREKVAQKDFVNARAKIEWARGADPTYADSYYLDGWIYQHEPGADRHLATEAFASAEQLQPWNVTYIVAYATALRDDARYDEAVAQFETAIARDPTNIQTKIDYAATIGKTAVGNPQQFKKAMDVYNQAYDALNRPGGNAKNLKGTVEAQMLQLAADSVAEAYRLASEAKRRAAVPAAATASASADGAASVDAAFVPVQKTLVDAGDDLLKRGYFTFANAFYRAAATRIQEIKGDDGAAAFRKELIAKLVGAADRVDNADQEQIIDIALDYDPDNEDLLGQKLRILYANEKSDAATQLADEHCPGKAKLTGIASALLPGWNCPPGDAALADPPNVALANGDYFTSFTDVEFPQDMLGTKLAVQRVYNSRAQFLGMFGYGWGNEFDAYLIPSADGSVIIQESGAGDTTRFVSPSLDANELDLLINRIVSAKSAAPDRTPVFDANAYRERLQHDADFRDQESRALGIMRELAPGAVLYSSARGTVQEVRKTEQGYLRDYGDGRKEYFEFRGNAFDQGVAAGSMRKLAGVYKITKIETQQTATNVQLQYDGTGNLIKITNAGGQSIELKHTAEGLVDEITSSSGGVAKYQYCPSAKYDEQRQCQWPDLTSTTDIDGNVYNYHYDNLHNMVALLHGDQVEESIQYWQDGQGVRSWTGNGVVARYEYWSDPFDPHAHYRTAVMTSGQNHAVSRKTSESWQRKRDDGSSYLDHTVLSMNDLNFKTYYNACCGRPLKIVYADNSEVDFAYDENTGLLKEKRQGGRIEQWQYSSQFPGKVTSYTEQDDSSGTGALQADFEYDAVGRLVSAKSPQKGSVKLSYDAAGQIVAVTDGDNQSIKFEYEASIQPTRIVVDGLGSIAVTYDKAGKIAGVQEEKSGNAQPGQVATRVSAALSLLTSLTDLANAN